MYEYYANLKGAVQTSLAIAAASSATIPATAALLPWRVLWSALTAARSATMCKDRSVHFKPGFVLPSSRVAGPLVRCMSCNKLGHVMCQSLPEIPPATAG